MVAVCETITPGPPGIQTELKHDPLSDEEIAQMLWGDEALVVDAFPYHTLQTPEMNHHRGCEGRMALMPLHASNHRYGEAMNDGIVLMSRYRNSSLAAAARAWQSLYPLVLRECSWKRP